jgi:hypothetical protein
VWFLLTCCCPTRPPPTSKIQQNKNEMERRKKSSLIGKFQQFKFSRRMGSRNVIARWINLKLLVFLPAATISFLFYFLFF